MADRRGLDAASAGRLLRLMEAPAQCRLRRDGGTCEEEVCTFAKRKDVALEGLSGTLGWTLKVERGP